MQRTIYRFFCYQCGTSHSSIDSYKLKTNDNLIHSIFCPTCNKWISINDTNLSGSRFKVVNTKKWSIIDEDSRCYQIVFESINKDYTIEICEQLNVCRLAANTNSIKINILDLIKWYTSFF